MATQYLSINEASLYLGLKKSFLYALVAKGDIPFYRVGRLIRFKQQDLDTWMEAHKVHSVNPDTKALHILKTVNRSNLNIDTFVKKTVAEFKENEYTSHHGKPDRIKGLRREVSHGTV
jgi:excisionase family DNA binding protein